MFTDVDEMAIKMTAYAITLTRLAESGRNILDDDDVKDTIVELTMEDEHYTDAQLDEFLASFRAVQHLLIHGD